MTPKKKRESMPRKNEKKADGEEISLLTPKKEEDSKNEDDDNWEIEGILAHSPVSATRRSKKLFYRVKWKLPPGQTEEYWPDIENWVASRGVFAPDMVNEYWKRVEGTNKSKLKKEELSQLPSDSNEASTAVQDSLKRKRNRSVTQKNDRRKKSPAPIIKKEIIVKQENTNVKKPNNKSSPIALRTRRSFASTLERKLSPIKKRKASEKKSVIENKEALLNKVKAEIKEEPFDPDEIKLANIPRSNSPVVVKKKNINVESVKIPPKNHKPKRNYYKTETAHRLVSNDIIVRLRNQLENRKQNVGYYEAKKSLLRNKEFKNKVKLVKNTVECPDKNNYGLTRIQRVLFPVEAEDIVETTDKVNVEIPTIDNTTAADHIFEYNDSGADLQNTHDEPNNSNVLLDLLNVKEELDDSDQKVYETMKPFLMKFANECWSRRYQALKNKLKPIHVLFFFESPADDVVQQDWSMTIFENTPGEEPQYVCECVPTEELWKIAPDLVTVAEKRFDRLIKESSVRE